ncbi:LuxS/MPP-like metallohydrolase [Abortiporus biennis]|nr:LuxS/MPP-like metallohydrolase [Abortiporus biennis]
MSTSEDWKDVPAEDNIPSYSVFTGQIEKPDPDDREYRIIRLQNGLLAALVHDAEADKSAACLTIAVGSLQDPDDVPGLAHFGEHMLSKGSEPFPEENDFLSFISSNGGIRNAGTGGSYQDYWFSIKPSLLKEALPRLAGFFSSPLFTPNLTAREIHAVDSENKRNLQNDARRMFQLGKSLSKPGHPWSKFGTGNYASLTEAARKKFEEKGDPATEDEDSGDGGPIGRETRRRLVEWWKEQYCASRMTLAVVGKESLDELAAMTVPLFAPIVNRGLDPRPAIDPNPWGDEDLGIEVFLKTVKDYHSFRMTFLLPDQSENYTTQPGQIIAHFVGHEGPGSVCSYLKKRGWLVDLSAYPSRSNREIHTFKVEGRLSKEGYLHYDEVILAIFDYIALLRDSPLDLYHFSEISTMSFVTFRFREKSQPHTFVSDLAYDLSEPFPPECVLSGWKLRAWDENLVRETLKFLTPERARVMLTARNHDSQVIGENPKWNTEKWYGTEYHVRRVSPECIARASEANHNPELYLPRPNPYIPENLTVDRKAVEHPAQAPTCICKSPLSTLWYKKDDQFWVPKAHVKVDIRSRLAYATPRHAVMTRLLIDVLEDDLSEITYDAELAGLANGLSNHRGGFVVSVSGYNDKLGVLLNTILERLKNLSIKPDRFGVIAEQLRREYQNFFIRPPAMLAEHYGTCVLMPIIWTPEDKLSELPYITLEDVERHKRDLLSKMYIEALITGNIEEEQAVSVIHAVEERLSARPLSRAERPWDRSLLLPPGSNYVLQKDVTDSKELNSSINYYCQFGDLADIRLRAIVQLLVHAMREPTFSQLRTVEQLGYIVAAAMWSSTASMGIGIKIQSLRSPLYLEQRIDAFLLHYQNTLAALTPEEFESKKDGLIIKLLERCKNLRDETARYWGRIRSGYYDFLRLETDAQMVRSLTLPEVVEAFNKYMHPSSKQRKKLSTHVLSKQLRDNTAANIILDGAEFIVDEALWKSTMTCSGAASPVESISIRTSEKPKL